MLSEGIKAPEFSLLDQNNIVRTLSQYKGQWILLYFYPKDDTPGCTKEACSLRDNFSEFAKNNIIVLGVSADSSKSHKEFSNKYNLDFPLLADTNKKVIRDYDANFLIFTKRISYLINPDGIIAKAYAKVIPGFHAEEVLNDVNNLKE